MLLKEAYSKTSSECPIFSNFQFSNQFKKELYKIIHSINLLPMSLVEPEKDKINLNEPCIYYIDKGEIEVIIL